MPGRVTQKDAQFETFRWESIQRDLDIFIEFVKAAPYYRIIQYSSGEMHVVFYRTEAMRGKHRWSGVKKYVAISQVTFYGPVDTAFMQVLLAEGKENIWPDTTS